MSAPNDETRAAASRRQRVLEAAVVEFADHGFEGATWRGIADRAGVSQGLIKFYFEDKAGLWRAALLRAHESQQNELPPRPPGGWTEATRAQSADWIRAYVRHAARHPDYLRMMIRESKPESARIAWAADAVLREAHQEFQDALQALQARGTFTGADPVSLHYALIGAVHQPFLAAEEIRTVYGRDPFGEVFVAAHAEAMVRVFLGEG